MTTYQFDHAWMQARARLAAFEQTLDPTTIWHLERLGVTAGWRCLEVGAGGGSIAHWLCQRVGPTGAVLATDIDTRFLAALTAPNLEVRRHDIVVDRLPTGAFDLVHTRLLLVHLPDRKQVLQRLVAALRPGGLLLCEEHDWTSFAPLADVVPEAAALFQKYKHAELQSALEADFDRTYGRHLYGDMMAAGLEGVTADGFLEVTAGSDEVFRLGIAQRRERILATGRISEEELDQFVALRENPAFVLAAPTAWAVWGRRSADESAPARPARDSREAL